MTLQIEKLRASLYEFLITCNISDGFILCSVTDWVSVAPEIRMKADCNIVPETPRIFLIGAGLAMSVGGLTGVLTQVRILDVGICLFG